MITPLFPELFGEPFPLDHPWSATIGRVYWEVQTPKVHLLDGEGCTACRRGLPRCKGIHMRMTRSFYRTTCARCIRAALHREGTDIREVIDDIRGMRGALSEVRLAKAIGWWRMSGARAHRAPEWIHKFFVVQEGT